MQTQRDVLYLDTQQAPLPLAMREAYLGDLQSWVIAMCRAAARRGAAADRCTVGLIDALYGRGGSEADILRWRSIGPHANLRREFGLSDDAVSILLLVTAPRLWGALAHVYAAIRLPTAGVISQFLLATLMDSRTAVLTELAREAPLVRHGLVSIRPTGAIVASSTVVRQLAGTAA